MFSAVNNKKFRSFAFYLCMGYVIVYALCSLCIYFIVSHAITKSARGYDKQDVTAESEELVELIEQNADGNLLAEQVITGRYPPSTIFIVRVINQQGLVEYTITWPRKIELPDWRAYSAPVNKRPLPRPGLSEYHIKTLNRHIQIQTTLLSDGRALQVGKGSFLEIDQKSLLRQLLLVFAALSTLFSVISGIVMMFITLRPIDRITASMSTIINSGAFEKGAPPVKSMIAELNTLGQLFTVMTQKYANLIVAMRQTIDNVAHDFRTPLTRIRGAAELALSESELSPVLGSTLADIIEDCDHAQLQLQNLMDVREMESGFVKLDIQPFSLEELLSEIIDLYSLVAEDKRITLSKNYPHSTIMTYGDRTRLARVFANLLDNALKYTPQAGSVTLTISHVAEAVKVSVSDTGIGIPPGELTLIWQRLFRGQQVRHSEKGLGLGLNIVQVIIAAHHGSVDVQSAINAGTTFTVTLPQKAPPA